MSEEPDSSPDVDRDDRRGDLRISEELERATRPVNPGERRALSIFALAAVLAVLRVVEPIGIGLFMGMLTAFTLQPLHRRLTTILRRPALSALLCTALVGLSALATLSGLAYLIVQRGLSMSSSLVVALQPGGTLRTIVDRWPRRLTTWHLQPAMLIERLREAASHLVNRVGAMTTAVAGLTASGLLGFFFLLLTTWYVLQNWGALIRQMELLLPINPRHTRSLLNEFRRVGKSVLLGTVLTGAAQGVLAALGYLIARVPEATFFGVLTAVASLVPAVGTLLVWVPLALYLLFTGHAVAGVFLLIYGLVIVVGVSDYVIRPALVGGHGEMPALLTFIALFGGVEAFGLIGLVLGPVIISLSVALLRIYGQEAARDRQGVLLSS